MAMHRKAKKTMAQRMVAGGSAGRRPESFWKKTNQGNLMPACRNTPAEAAVSASHTYSRWPSAADCDTMDLETKPEVSGNEEMASAPMVPQTVVSGMVWNRPPSSEHLRRPVISSTDPADISSRAL
ncbi:hypothetical protein Y695_04013 [Hydrogenophaga sp. T4]|nr:hypothetical protein Y695_04013 [Hydrogenophaga sp. T4]